MVRQEKFQEEYDNSDKAFVNFVKRFIPYWPLFLVLAAIGLAGAYAYMRYIPPVYQSSTKLLIKDEMKGIYDSQIMETFDGFGSKKIVENEIEVIKSIELLSRVVRNQKLYASFVKEGRLMDVSAYVTSPIIIEARYPDSLFDSDKIYFRYDDLSNTVIIDSQSYSLNEWHNMEFGEVKFQVNPWYAPAGDNKPMYFTIESVYSVATQLLGQIAVEPASKMASIIILRLNDPVTRRAENILADLISEYNKASVEDKNVLASNTLSFINSRLSLLVDEIDSVESRILDYKNRNNIVDISEQGRLFLESAEKTNEEVSRYSVHLEILDQVQKYVAGDGESPAILPSTLGDTDPILAALLDKLYSLELRYHSLKKTTAENNPVLLALVDDINLLKPKIIQNIQVKRKSLQVGTSVFGDEKNRYASILNKIPQKERELLQISRQQSIKNSIYSFLLQRREETALSLAGTVSDSRLIDKPHSTLGPVAPNRNIVMFVALLVAFFIGVIIVFIRDILSPYLLLRSQVEEVTDTPIIAEISQAPGNKNSIVFEQQSRGVVAEQFRQLRTSLSFVGINNRSKRLLITSSISGEGKTFISSNLAVTLALGDKKIVLLELDLRKPRISKAFGVDNSNGITNYLIGDVDIKELLVGTSISENLFLLPSGPLPPNPAELILNGRMERLLAELETMFDIIVIDTAPVNPVTDALVLSPMCDATIYVVRQGITPRAVFNSLVRSFKFRSLKNTALVINGIRKRRAGQYSSPYEYAYAYTEPGGSIVKKKGNRTLSEKTI